MAVDIETTTRQMTEVRALRMLRAGDSIKDVSAAVGLTVAQVEALRRDFPAGSTAPQRLAPSVPSVTLAAEPDPLGRLLDKAAKHKGKRIQGLAAKVTADLDRLRALLAAEAERTAEQRKRDEERAWAAAEVAKLEKQLREAKAKLRGGSAQKATTSAPGNVGSRPCVECGGEVVRQPGQMGASPKRCQNCR